MLILNSFSSSEHCLCIIVKIYILQTNPKEVWISRSYLVMPFEK